MTYSNKWVDNPLPILLSARIRITNEQRKAVKDAYYARKNSLHPQRAWLEEDLPFLLHMMG